MLTKRVRRKRSRSSFLTRLQALIDGEAALLGSIITFGVIISLLSLAVPIAVQSLVNSVAFGSLTQQLYILSAVVFLVLSFSGILGVAQLVAAEFLQQRLFVRIALDLSERMSRFSAEGFRDLYGSEMVNPFLEVSTLQKSVSHILVSGLGLILQIAVGILLLTLYHPVLLLFSVVITLTIAFIFFVLGRNGIQTADDECNAKYQMVEWLEDLVGMFPAFRETAGLAYARSRTDFAINAWLSARRLHFRVLLFQNCTSYFVHAAISAALLGVGGYLVIQGQLTLGQLVASELIVSAALSGLIKFGKHLESLYDMAAALEKLKKLRCIPLEDTDGDIPEWDTKSPAALEVKNLYSNVSYGGRAILNGVNLTMAPGDRVAILGENNSGKTVLAECITQLTKPERGEVLIDNHHASDVDLFHLRSRVALVTKPHFFHGTIEENLCFSAENVSRKDIRETLALLELDEKISCLEDGLETEVTPRTNVFSYGEVVRLSIARALLARPGLIVFDQCLDAVDERSLSQVMQVLLDPELPCTILALTHDRDITQLFPYRYRLAEGVLKELEEESGQGGEL
ncbi:ABC transporter ATP-binding protein/permease [bacterium]|nr:ABC transporter ATP-binding protein/permease [bacterium]